MIAEIIVEQAVLFGRSVACGILLGVWYEVFRTLRKTIAHKDAMVHLEDLIFCVSGAVCLFFLFHIYNQGQLRFYVLAGLMLGGMLYFFCLFLPVQWTLQKMMGLFLLVSGKILKKICLPLKIVVNSMVKSLKKALRTVRIIKNKK